MKIEVYAFNMALLTYDADMFMTNKECIRLLYCNHKKWGDGPNHYDLLHQIEEHRDRGKTFHLRSEESGRAHKAHTK